MDRPSALLNLFGFEVLVSTGNAPFYSENEKGGLLMTERLLHWLPFTWNSVMILSDVVRVPWHIEAFRCWSHRFVPLFAGAEWPSGKVEPYKFPILSESWRSMTRDSNHEYN